MARRYCGSILIRIHLEDSCGEYLCSLPGWQSYIGAPASGFGPGVSYDSPTAFDQTARAAISFAMNDGAVDGHGLELDPHGNLMIRRKAPKHDFVDDAKETCVVCHKDVKRSAGVVWHNERGEITNRTVHHECSGKPRKVTA